MALDAHTLFFILLLLLLFSSQNEFIELVGFDGPAVPDDPPPNKAKKDSPVSALKRGEQWACYCQFGLNF